MPRNLGKQTSNFPSDQNNTESLVTDSLAKMSPEEISENLDLQKQIADSLKKKKPELKIADDDLAELNNQVKDLLAGNLTDEQKKEFEEALKISDVFNMLEEIADLSNYCDYLYEATLHELQIMRAITNIEKITNRAPIQGEGEAR